MPTLCVKPLDGTWVACALAGPLRRALLDTFGRVTAAAATWLGLGRGKDVMTAIGKIHPVSAKPPPVRGARQRRVRERNVTEVRRQEALLKTGALQNAILNSANFSSIATDEKGVIQVFNVGPERMLGYAASEVLDQITPADISDPQEVIARAKALSVELATPITPGFDA